MKFKKIITVILVFAMTLSYIPSVPLAQASDNAYIETNNLNEEISDNIEEIAIEDCVSEPPKLGSPDLIEDNLEQGGITILTDNVESIDSVVEMKFSANSMISDDSVLNVSVVEPDGEQMLSVMGQYSILAALDALVLDINANGISTSDNVDFNIKFNNPYLKSISTQSAYFAEVKKDGSIKAIQESQVFLNNENLIIEFNLKISHFDERTRIILITSDQPMQTGSGWKEYIGYTRRAEYYSPVLQADYIGSSDGGLMYHCWTADDKTAATDFAICLNNLRVFGSGDGWYGSAITDSSGKNDNSPTSEWKYFSTALRSKLILLLAYGMDTDSSFARFDILGGDTYAAMQLVAWEWIRGKGEGEYTRYYSERIQNVASELRTLVRTNPDGIDTAKTKVYLIWPECQRLVNGEYKWGQPLLAIEDEPVTYKGSLSITKQVVGAGPLSGWILEIYGSQTNAENRTNRLGTAVTDANGTAIFKDLEPDVTYYIREAPAEIQTNPTAGWSISASILNGTVVASKTTSVGTLTNISPAKVSVSKNIIPSSYSTDNLAGWIFEIYNSASDANNAVNYIASSVTNNLGIAYFDNLPAGTYYVREAPVSRQNRLLDGWVISDEVLRVEAAAGATSYVSAGTVTNYISGDLSVSKKIRGVVGSEYISQVDNWKFEIFETEENAKNGINYIGYAYTNAEGIATFTDLIAEKRYYIKEAPLSRQDRRDASGWYLSSAVLSGVAGAGETVFVGDVENMPPNEIIVEKDIISYGDFTADKNNWRFELYTSKNDANAGTGYIAFAYTDINGVAVFNKLQAGAYYLREAPAHRQDRWNTQGWTLSTEVKQILVLGGASVSIGTVSNSAPAQITGRKSILSESGANEKLSGWIYQIASDPNFSNVVSTATSDANGAWSTGFILLPGTYYVREAPMEIQTRSDKYNFILDNSVVVITVASGESGEAYKNSQIYTSQNIEKGKIQVKKDVFGIVADSSSLSNWIFKVYSDENCTQYVTSITTGADGLGTSILLVPGTYWIKEAPQSEQIRSDISMWAISENVVPVVVRAGAIANAYGNNNSTVTNFYGKYIRLTKVANNVQNPDCYNQIKDNNMYTLAGAQYQIVVNGEVRETITTDSTGIVISNNIYTVGTSGIIKEIVAPAGYLLDSTEYYFRIEATTEEYCEVCVSDIPVFDPNIQQFKKVDAETGVAQGNTTFGGAIFRWDYYDNTSWSGDPVRTWYFRTNNNGLYGYHGNYLANDYQNDLLYFSSNNIPQLPLGSVKITEIVAPLGYLVFEKPMYATIEQPAMGSQAVWAYTPETLEFLRNQNGTYVGNEAENASLLGSLSIQKLDKDYGVSTLNWSTLEGCEFAIYNRSNGPVKIGANNAAQPNEICAVLVVDKNGFASIDGLPIGTYEIKEIKGNDFYQCNTEWSQTFTIDGSSNNPNFAFTCEDTMKPAVIRLQKVNTLNEVLAGSKFLLEYSIDGQTDWNPVFKSNDIVVGGCSNENLTQDGCLIVPASGEIAFEGLYPVVYYRITEIETPSGYQLLKDPVIINSQTELTPDNNFEVGYRIVNNETFAMPKTGVSDFWMLMPCFLIAAIAMFCGIYVITLPEKKKYVNN